MHYNTARPHQGIAQRVPDEEPDAACAAVTDIDRQQISRKPVLGGLINGFRAPPDPDPGRLAGRLPNLCFSGTGPSRARSVLTFFAQDSGTHNLVYANADVSKASQAREAIVFCDHWRQVSGSDPKMLIMDQKVTTQEILGELDERGIKFATLRMRSRSLVRHINSLAPSDFTTITLKPGRPTPPDHPRGSRGPRSQTSPATPGPSGSSSSPASAAAGLPSSSPTTTGVQKPRALVQQYTHRMTIEQRLAEIIRAFCADALSSTVNLNVDLDVMLAVLACALTAALRARLPGYAAATPDTIQRRFLETPGQITTAGKIITVRLERRAFSPVLRKAQLPADTPRPWWGGRTIRYELT